MVMWLRSPTASDLLEMFGMAMARAGYVVIAVDQPGNNSVAHYDFWLHRKNRSQSGQCRLRVRLGGKSPVANDQGHTAWTLKGDSPGPQTLRDLDELFDGKRYENPASGSDSGGPNRSS
jgi:hypothetical protein